MKSLKVLNQGIKLIESMYASQLDGVRHLSMHTRRLQASAQKLGFEVNLAEVVKRLLHECGALPSGAAYRLRLTLAMDGEFEITHAPLAPIGRDVVDVLLSNQHGFESMQSDDELLLHKTTRREAYDRAWQQAERQGAFDMLFFNDRGELTEGGRSNVFLKIDGLWYTPPLSSGLLPGVMRAVLLGDPEWNAAERVILESDLMRADALIVCNALRGVLSARVA
jgi:para-aminobenzoate synthetase / 4-amino-4-deoxychorismate lyase